MKPPFRLFAGLAAAALTGWMPPSACAQEDDFDPFEVAAGCDVNAMRALVSSLFNAFCLCDRVTVSEWKVNHGDHLLFRWLKNSPG